MLRLGGHQPRADSTSPEIRRLLLEPAIEEGALFKTRPEYHHAFERAIVLAGHPPLPGWPRL
jgi:hypothetical protein